MSLADRLAAESRPDQCTTCRALRDLIDDEFELFTEVRAGLSLAAQARVLDVGESSFKRHVAAGHHEPR